MKAVTFRPASGGPDKRLMFEAERLPPLVRGYALSRFGGRPRRRGVSAASMAEVRGKHQISSLRVLLPLRQPN
jgi:hypothetical protein